MPLYVQDLQLASDLPEPFRRALLQMVVDVFCEPVNPARALQLIRSRVRPLLPLGHQDLLEIDGQPSWQRLHFLYPKLVFASSSGETHVLTAAATLVDIVVRFSTRPARELVFPPFVEVSSFARVCDYLRLPVANPLLQVGQTDLDLYSFCRFCWLPAQGRGVCQFHSLRTLPLEPPGRMPACTSVSFKSAQRLRDSFEKAALSLASKEELAFHNSDFTMPFLVPASGLRGWLAERRPRLAAHVGPPRELPDRDALGDLLGALYGWRGPEVAKGIGLAVHLLTPITLRAEAWLSAWEERPKWGGARRRSAGTELDLPVPPAQ